MEPKIDQLMNDAVGFRCSCSIAQMDVLSPSALLEIFCLLDAEDTYHLNEPAYISYLLHLKDGQVNSQELRRHSTSEGYHFAVNSSLYILFDEEHPDRYATATPFGTVVPSSPVKERFLGHLSTLRGDVAFVDPASEWSVPAIIDVSGFSFPFT